MSWNINKDLLILKCLYFFELSVVACLFIYITPFMYEYGVTATELAVINFIAHIIAFFSRPVFGFMADKYQKYREIIAISSIFCIFVNSVQLAIPKYGINQEKYIFLGNLDNITKLTMCRENTSMITCWPSLFDDNCSSNSSQIILNQFVLFPINISCSKLPISLLNDQSVKSTNEVEKMCTKIITDCTALQINNWSSKSHSFGFTLSLTFFLFLIIKIMGYSLFSAILSLTDAVTFVILGKDRCHEFGFTRMFGTIGILLLSILTGLVLHSYEILNKSDHYTWIKQLMKLSKFFPCFILGLSLFCPVILLTMFLRKDKPIHTEHFWKSLNWLFHNVEVSIFFIFSVLGGFTFAVFIEYYFLIIYQMFQNLPPYFPGVIFSVMTLAEAIFIGASSIILKFMNDEFWISLAFIAWSIRWLSYLFVTNFWLLILVEFLNGPAFGLMLPCMMSHISKFATKSTQGRIQCLFSGLYFNIGGALGSLYGGIMIDKFGYRTLFITMSILSLISGIIYYPLKKIIVPKYFKKPFDINEAMNDENNKCLLNIESAEINI